MLSLYVHFPFCLKKCSYCAFNSYVLNTIDYHDWLEKYCQSLLFFAKKTSKEPLSSIYFGGGTPSLMPPFMIEGILKYAEKLWGLSDDCEISIEANPNTINQKVVNNFKLAGINRISIGVQSFDNRELAFLGRIHDSKQAFSAIDASQKTFDNVSIDLIYGLPNQTVKAWQKNLDAATALDCSHYSLYQLSIEPDSQFYVNNTPTIDEKTAVKMFKLNQSFMQSAGFPQYEISNYSKQNRECRHNLWCWQGYDYIGIGAGACGRIKNHNFWATQQSLKPEEWFKNPDKASFERLSKRTKALELLIVGLRTAQGIDSEVFYKNSNYKLFNIVNKPILNEFISLNMLKIKDNFLYATPKGLVFLDHMLQKIA